MPTTYHHGDLPGALVSAAVEILDEEGGANDYRCAPWPGGRASPPPPPTGTSPTGAR